MTTAEIRPLAGQLRDGVRLIDYFIFLSVSNCLRYAHKSALRPQVRLAAVLVARIIFGRGVKTFGKSIDRQHELYVFHFVFCFNWNFRPSVLAAMAKIRSDFNLTVARMDKFTHLMPGISPLIKQIAEYATSAGAKLLLKRVGASAAVAELAKYAPAVGAVVAGAVSFAAVLLVLRTYIDDCYKIADEMLKAHFQG